MAANSRAWLTDHMLWLEAFVLANFVFLGPDIYLAHATNSFRHSTEYIPLAFSLAAPFVLLAGLIARQRYDSNAWWRRVGYAVGWLAVAIGVLGLLLHLESRFFQEATLESLVYTAPFVAPLAYAGLGLLLIMNRMVDSETEEWPRWVLLLALGGFVGNFILSLADHAQNGFYHATEWIPVAAGAFAVGFLLVPFLITVDRTFVYACVPVMLLEAAVGILGFYYHTAANLHGPGPGWFNQFVYGAPALAPLLFPNMVLLTGIGLVVLHKYLPAATATSWPSGLQRQAGVPAP